MSSKLSYSCKYCDWTSDEPWKMVEYHIITNHWEQFCADLLEAGIISYTQMEGIDGEKWGCKSPTCYQICDSHPCLIMATILEKKAEEAISVE